MSNINISTSILKLIVFLFLLPLILFVYSWYEYWISIPLVLASLYLVFKIEFDQALHFDWSKRALILFSVIAAILFCLQVYVGFTGLFPQHGDFIARNAIYGTLCKNEWPVYSYEGYPLISYFMSWLPSAGLSKLLGWEWRNWIQLCFFWLLILASYLLICFRCKKMTILPLVALCTLDFVPRLFKGFEFYECFGNVNICQKIHGLTAGTSYYLDAMHQWGTTTNHAAITILATSILILQFKQRWVYLFVGAASFCYSPLGACALLPIVIYQSFAGTIRENLLKLIKSPMSYASLLLLFVTMVFYTQCPFGTAEFHFLSRLQIEPSFYLNIALLYAVNLSILLMLVYRVAKTDMIVMISAIVFISLPFIYYGYNYNELMFKACLPLFVVLASVYPQIWEKRSPFIPKAVATIMIVCFCVEMSKMIPFRLNRWDSPTNIDDPCYSDYYSPAARSHRVADKSGFRYFGGVVDVLPTPLVKGILREKK